jgi:hypothetical protein
MKKLNHILQQATLISLLLSVGCVSLHRRTVNILAVRADKNGNKPKDIAEEFMQAARSRDYEAAKIHWAQEGIEHYEVSEYWGGFEGYCNKMNQHPAYKFNVSTMSKDGRWLRIYWYDDQGEKLDVGWSLYFRKIDDQWFIVQ